MNTSTTIPQFPEVQIADAMNCAIEDIVADDLGWFLSPDTCTVTVFGKPVDCYFGNNGKLEMILGAREGDLVWKN